MLIKLRLMMLFCPDALKALRTGRPTMADALPRLLAAKLDIEQGRHTGRSSVARRLACRLQRSDHRVIEDHSADRDSVKTKDVFKT